MVLRRLLTPLTSMCFHLSVLRIFGLLIFSSFDRLVVNEDIDAIIARGEERTIKLNSKYEGLNLEDLNNFKSDASVQQWEGEDFRGGVRRRCILP